MISVIILAGGIGSRVGADRPKQFVEVLGKPIVAYTIEQFEKREDIISVEIVCHPEWKKYMVALVEQYHFSKVKWIVDGGIDFQHSCMNGINNLEGELKDTDYVLIQYAAAPFTSNEIIDDVIRVMKQKNAAISATPCFQLMGTNEGEKSESWVDRDKFIQVASPYGFQYGYIKSVYKRAREQGLLDTIEPHVTSLIYALGEPLYNAYGNQTNIKITTQEDLELFEGYVLLKQWKKKGNCDVAER